MDNVPGNAVGVSGVFLAKLLEHLAKSFIPPLALIVRLARVCCPQLDKHLVTCVCVSKLVGVQWAASLAGRRQGRDEPRTGDLHVVKVLVLLLTLFFISAGAAHGLGRAQRLVWVYLVAVSHGEKATRNLLGIVGVIAI